MKVRSEWAYLLCHSLCRVVECGHTEKVQIRWPLACYSFQAICICLSFEQRYWA